MLKQAQPYFDEMRAKYARAGRPKLFLCYFTIKMRHFASSSILVAYHSTICFMCQMLSI